MDLPHTQYSSVRNMDTSSILPYQIRRSIFPEVHTNGTVRCQAIPLRREHAEEVEGDTAIQITQHPEGRPKQSAIQVSQRQ